MSKKIIMSALVAAAFASSVPAFAQDQYRSDRDSAQQQYDSQRSQEQRGNDGWQDQRSNDRWQNDRTNEHDSRWQARRDYERQRSWEWRHRHERHDDMAGGWGRSENFNSGYDGAGPYHNLRRGERLPSRYRTNQYVVDNWRGHHLSRPPHGYHWVQTGADYVLVGVSSGIIAQIMMSQ